MQDIKEKSFNVPQGQMAFIRKGDGKITRLGTFGIGPCVGVVIMDKANGHALLGHFDNPRVIASSLLGFLYQMGKQNPIDIALLSKDKNNTAVAKQAIEDIIKNNNIKISSLADLSHNMESGTGLSIAADVETGEILTDNIIGTFPPLVLTRFEVMQTINNSIHRALLLHSGEDPKIKPIYPNGNPYAIDRERNRKIADKES